MTNIYSATHKKVHFSRKQMPTTDRLSKKHKQNIAGAAIVTAVLVLAVWKYTCKNNTTASSVAPERVEVVPATEAVAGSATPREVSVPERVEVVPATEAVAGSATPREVSVPERVEVVPATEAVAGSAIQLIQSKGLNPEAIPFTPLSTNIASQESTTTPRSSQPAISGTPPRSTTNIEATTPKERLDQIYHTIKRSANNTLS